MLIVALVLEFGGLFIIASNRRFNAAYCGYNVALTHKEFAIGSGKTLFAMTCWLAAAYLSRGL